MAVRVEADPVEAEAALVEAELSPRPISLTEPDAVKAEIAPESWA